MQQFVGEDRASGERVPAAVAFTAVLKASMLAIVPEMRVSSAAASADVCSARATWTARPWSSVGGLAFLAGAACFCSAWASSRSALFLVGLHGLLPDGQRGAFFREPLVGGADLRCLRGEPEVLVDHGEAVELSATAATTEVVVARSVMSSAWS